MVPRSWGGAGFRGPGFQLPGSRFPVFDVHFPGHVLNFPVSSLQFSEFAVSVFQSISRFQMHGVILMDLGLIFMDLGAFWMLFSIKLSGFIENRRKQYSIGKANIKSILGRRSCLHLQIKFSFKNNNVHGPYLVPHFGICL